MRIALFGIAIVYCILFSPCYAHAAIKSARICNHAGQTVFIALGWTNNLINQSTGWFVIADSTCKVLLSEEADSLTAMFAYAVGRNGNEYLPSSTMATNEFCIDRKDAFRKSAFACGAADFAAQEATGNRTITVSTWQPFAPMTTEGLFSLNSYQWDIQ